MGNNSKRKITFSAMLNTLIRMINPAIVEGSWLHGILKLLLFPMAFVFFLLHSLFLLLDQYHKKPLEREILLTSQENTDPDTTSPAVNLETAHPISFVHLNKTDSSVKYLYASDSMIIEEKEDLKTMKEKIEQNRKNYEKNRNLREFIANMEGVGANMYAMMTNLPPEKDFSEAVQKNEIQPEIVNDKIHRDVAKKQTLVLDRFAAMQHAQQNFKSNMFRIKQAQNVRRTMKASRPSPRSIEETFEQVSLEPLPNVLSMPDMSAASLDSFLSSESMEQMLAVQMLQSVEQSIEDSTLQFVANPEINTMLPSENLVAPSDKNEISQNAQNTSQPKAEKDSLLDKNSLLQAKIKIRREDMHFYEAKSKKNKVKRLKQKAIEQIKEKLLLPKTATFGLSIKFKSDT